MGYCEGDDLFTQILHQRRYLGQDELVKHVFLQLLNAVEYSHLLDAYHRDSRPGGILCFDGGLRPAIMDFELATTRMRLVKSSVPGKAYLSREPRYAINTPFLIF